MYLRTVVVISMCAGLVYGQSSQCQKPDGKSDECISLLKCRPLREELNKKNKTDKDLYLLSKLLTKLHCGSVGVPFVPKVCCPEPETGQRIINPPQCSTPDGKLGKCINLFSCPHFAILLQPPVPQDTISFVQSFRCLGPEEHSVCCGPPPTIQTPAEFDTLEDPAEPADCPALMTAYPPDRSSECCGVSVGGLSTDILHQHPWAVLIDYELKKGGTRRMCAGTLISARYALTAAHCTTGQILKIATPISVRLGEYDLNHKGKDCVSVDGASEDCNDGPISIAIETTILHPNYNDPASKQNDIALIRLKEAAPYTDFIRPICLPTKNLESSPPDSPLVAVSWFKDVNTKDIKMLVKVPFVDQEKCQNMYKIPGRNSMHWKGQICAGGIEGMDTCKGDGGSPLVYENQGRSELIGTASFGLNPCGQKGVPAIYSNVYEYIVWIKSHIVP